MLARRLIAFFLFTVLCAISAYWIMVLRAPRPVVVAQAPRIEPPKVFDQTVHARLFGGAATGSQTTNVRVVGVIAPGKDQRGGVAVLSIDGKPPRAYGAGQTLDNGQRVARVSAERVVLDQGGTSLELTVPRPRAGVGTMSQSGAAPTLPSGGGMSSSRVLSGQPAPQYQPIPQPPPQPLQQTPGQPAPTAGMPISPQRPEGPRQ